MQAKEQVSRSRRILLLVSVFTALLLSLLILAMASSQRASTATSRYLAFQMFTETPFPNVPTDGSSANTLATPPSKAAMSQFARQLVDRIGTTGDANTRLAVMIGPLAFDHTDAQLQQMIADAFEIALEQNIAVGFHIDDSLFWGRRTDLWSDPANIEWLDWVKTPSTGRTILWGPEPTRLTPQMCFNSPAIEAAVQHESELIGDAVSKGVALLKAQIKPDLFAGVVVGWETMIGRDFATDQYLGYCALSYLGFSQEKPPQDPDAEGEKVVQAFIELWADGISGAGVDPAKIYSHTAVTSRQTYGTMQTNNSKGSELTYSQVNQFAPPSVSFGKHYNPGFSTYPQPGLMDQLYDELKQHNNPAWASSEGANIAPDSLTSGGSMETYLASMFNHGAALVNIFGWGIGDKTNAFRLAADSPDALTAYRKFLHGDTLIEGKYSFASLPDKIKSIQNQLPMWLQQHPDRQPEIEALMHQLEGYSNDKNIAEGIRIADEILAIVSP